MVLTLLYVLYNLPVSVKCKCLILAYLCTLKDSYWRPGSAKIVAMNFLVA